MVNHATEPDVESEQTPAADFRSCAFQALTALFTVNISDCCPQGVAYHHAGITTEERQTLDAGVGACDYRH